MADMRTTVELVVRDDGCIAIVVRRDDYVAQTPWLIGEGVRVARGILEQLRKEYPNDCFTLIGFVA